MASVRDERVILTAPDPKGLNSRLASIRADSGYFGAVSIQGVPLPTHIIGEDSPAKLENKSLVDATTDIVNDADVTKRIVFDAGASNTGSTTTIATGSSTGSQRYTLPATDTDVDLIVSHGAQSIEAANSVPLSLSVTGGTNPAVLQLETDTSTAQIMPDSREIHFTGAADAYIRINPTGLGVKYGALEFEVSPDGSTSEVNVETGTGLTMSDHIISLALASGSVPGAMTSAHYSAIQGATSASTPNTLVMRDGSANIAANNVTANLIGNATSATNFSGSLAGDITGTQSTTLIATGAVTNAKIATNAAIADTKLATISTAGKVLNSATTATSANTASAIVARDSNGDIYVNNVFGNVASSSGFTGSLSGDIIGTQGATQIASEVIVNADISPTAGIVDTKLATISTAGKVLNSATTATSTNVNGAIMARDGSGNVTATTVIANLTGTASNATTAVNFSGALSGQITGTQTNTTIAPGAITNSHIDANAAIVDTKLATISTAGKVLNSATTATSANTNSTIMARDGSGNVSATTVTANLVGNATTATSAANFSGSLAGDVTGTQGATVLADGVVTNAKISASAAIADTKLATISTALKVSNSATTATSANTAGAIMARDGSGNVSATTVTANLVGNATTATSAGTFSGSLAGDVTGTQNATVIASGAVNDSKIASNAAIVDTKLATISTAGKVLNSATTATSANVNGAIVARDGSGNISASSASLSSATITQSNGTGSLSIRSGSSGAYSSLTMGRTANEYEVGVASLSGQFSTSAATGDVVHRTLVGTSARHLFCIGTSASTLAISNTGVAVLGGANFVGPLSGNVTGNVTGNLTGDVTSTGINIFNQMITMAGTSTSGSFHYAMRTGVINRAIVGLVGDESTGNAGSDFIIWRYDDAGGNIGFYLRGNRATGSVTFPELVYGNINGSATSFTGALIGDVTGTQGATVLADGVVTNAKISASAGIVDTKLATISTAGKVLNSATTATSANTTGAIAARDSNGDITLRRALLNSVYCGSVGTYGSVYMSGGNTFGGLYAAPTAVGDGLHFGYNYTSYGSGDGATPAIISTSYGASRVTTTATNISLAVSGTNVAPDSSQERLRVTTTQIIAANGAIFVGSLSGTSTGFSGSLAGHVSGTQGNTVISNAVITDAHISSSAAISDNKLAQITTGGKVANSATTATSANTAGAIMARDVSGNVTATTVIANLTGTATNATTAVNFSGSLAGDVTGTQGATVLADSVVTNAKIAANAAIVDTKLATISTAGKVLNSATTATNVNTAGAIMARDGSGNVSATTVTANLVGNATTATSFTGSLAGDVTGTQGATVLADAVVTNAKISASAAIADTKLATISTAGKVLNSATTATSVNTNSTIIARDGTGSFAATTITANLVGNATTATSATNFSGSLAGDVTGTQSATVIASGAITDAKVAAGAGIVDTKLATISTAGKVLNSATTATSVNTAGAIMARDGSGNVSAGTITANLAGNATTATTSTNFTGSLSGDVTGIQTATVIASGAVNDSKIAANAAIVDTKLATISTAGKVLNSATTATSANTAGAIMARDGSGNVTATTVTANLTGTATNATTAVNFSGSLAGDITGTQGATTIANGVITDAKISAGAAIVDTKLSTISTAGKVSNSATTATSANTTGAIAARDGNGDITLRRALLNSVNCGAVGTYGSVNLCGGNSVGGLYPAFTAFTDGVHFGYNYTSYGSVDGQTPTIQNAAGAASRITAGYDRVIIAVSNAINVAPTSTQERLTITATAITANNGAVFVGNLTGNASSTTNFSGSLAGDVTGTQSATAIASGVITNTHINASAAIADTKLATISTSGKVANTATTATSSNNASTIMMRDVSGNFAASSASLANATLTTANGNGVVNVRSGATGSYASYALGRTSSEFEIGIAAVGGQFFTDALAGDIIMRMSNASSRILLGIGSGTSTIMVNSTSLVASSGMNFVGNLTGVVTNAGVNTFSAMITKAGTSAGGTFHNAMQTTGGVNRAIFALIGAESTGNVGSDLIIWRYDDGGGNIGNYFRCERSTGIVTFSSTIAGNISGSAASFTGSLAGNITGTQGATVIANNVITNAMINSSAAIADTKLATISTTGKVANSATTAVSGNANDTIMLRDGSGSFAAGTAILGAVSVTAPGGNGAISVRSGSTSSIVSYALGRTSNELEIGIAAGAGQFFSDATAGDVIMRMANASSRILLGTGVGTASTVTVTGTSLVASSGMNFVGPLTGNVTGNVSGSAASFTGSLVGNITGTQGATVIASNVITNAMINSSAAIADTKLATISTALKVSNSATTAVSTNTANAIMARDGSGNFNAGTANLLRAIVTAANVTGGISLLSGSSSGYASSTIGRTTTELEMGVAAASDQFMTGTVAGDSVMRTLGGKLFMGVSTSATATIDGSALTVVNSKILKTGINHFTNNVDIVTKTSSYTTPTLYTLGASNSSLRFTSSVAITGSTTTLPFKITFGSSLLYGVILRINATVACQTDIAHRTYVIYYNPDSGGAYIHDRIGVQPSFYGGFNIGDPTPVITAGPSIELTWSTNSLPSYTNAMLTLDVKTSAFSASTVTFAG